jgi:UDP-glucose 4-epimerase
MGDGHRSRVLVTGGSGFIGRHVVAALLARGAAVTVADKRPFPGDAAIETVLGDLRDPSVVDRAVRPETDVIIHLAAVTRVLDSIADPVDTFRTNVDMTASLLEQARQREVGTFLLASTNAVAGDVGRATITEDLALRPLSPYGATKAAGEMMLSSYTACYGIAGCALRFSNVYGPGMAEKDSFVPRLMRAARDDRGVEVYGDGNQIRDLVHVDDIVAGIFAAWEAKATGPLILGAGESVTVNDMVTATRNVTGKELPVTYVPAKPGEMPAVIVDISRARSIGYVPEQDLKSGLATVWPEFAEAVQAEGMQ